MGAKGGELDHTDGEEDRLSRGYKMRKGTVKFIFLVAFIAAAVIITRALGLGQYLAEERLRAWIDGFGAWGPVVYVLIYSIAPVFMAPGLPLTVAGGVLFGPFWGVVYVAIGATIGASAAFLIARLMGREWVLSHIKGGGRVSELDRRTKEKGWRIVAFTRLIPLFPYNFLNYAFGLTGIGFLTYAVMSFVFMLPGIIAYVIFSSSLLDLASGRVSKEFLIGLLLVILVSLISILYQRHRGQRI